MLEIRPRARCPHRTGKKRKYWAANLQTMCRKRRSHRPAWRAVICAHVGMRASRFTWPSVQCALPRAPQGQTLFSTPVEKKDGYDIKLLSKCEYFTTYRVNVETKAELDADENSFNSILVLEGEPVISGGETVSAKKGESVFISAGTGKYTVEGKCTFVLTKID